MQEPHDRPDPGAPDDRAASGAPKQQPEEKALQDAGGFGPAHVASFVEQRILEATARGEFDNLPGAGRPLPLADSDDPEWWVKAKLAREQIEESDLVPTVIALRREAQTYPAALVEFTREEDVRAVIADYNRRVVEDVRRPTFGPTVPVVAPRLDADEMVEEWRVLRAELEARTPASSAPQPAPAQPRRRWWRRLLRR